MEKNTHKTRYRVKVKFKVIQPFCWTNCTCIL